MSEQRNDRYRLPGEIEFRAGPEGLLFADVQNALAHATVCLQGAHLTSWQPRSQAAPVIWLSSAARYASGKSIRGGVPICWPWFGPHAEPQTGSQAAGRKLPSHGFARTVAWDACDSRHLETGETQLCLELRDSEQTRALWPYPFHLGLRLTIGETLRLELSTTNTGSGEFVLGEALHTYFQVGDIGAVQVCGLDNAEFIDNANGARRGRQAAAITFEEEVDRVYVNSAADCAIVDPILKRRIRIAKSNSLSTVVWNPWTHKAASMGDLGPGATNQGGWREMLCVESGNALENAVRVAARATHCLTAQYRVEPL